MHQINRNTFELSTGRQFSANMGVIGLAPDMDRELFGVGCDSTEIVAATDQSAWHAPEGGNWTTGERLELAAFMADLWLAWGGVPVSAMPMSPENLTPYGEVRRP